MVYTLYEYCKSSYRRAIVNSTWNANHLLQHLFTINLRDITDPVFQNSVNMAAWAYLHTVSADINGLWFQKIKNQDQQIRASVTKYNVSLHVK